METLDMSEEKKPNIKKLLPTGWRDFKITGCSNEVTSKKGNKQYILKIQDKETGYEEDLYAVSEPKKRWFLKTILDACNVPSVDGKYDFEPPLSNVLIGKDIKGNVIHEPNNWINRNGEEVKAFQHRIDEVKSMEEKAWDE